MEAGRGVIKWSLSAPHSLAELIEIKTDVDPFVQFRCVKDVLDLF